MNGSFEIREYVENGRSSYADWFEALDRVAAVRVNPYVRRLGAGNFGAAKALQGGVFEMRMDFGPGYRVYYGREGQSVILLLGGGSMRRQEADIDAAAGRWTRYKEMRKP